MITVKAIFDDNGTASPEKIIENNGLGNNFDGINYYYFESQDEKNEYYKKLDTENGNQI